MNVYKISKGLGNHISTNRGWRAILKKEDDLKYQVTKSLNQGHPIEPVDGILNMYLINNSWDKYNYYDPFLLDLIYWTDDITLEAFVPDSFFSKYFIVSKKLKRLLDKYQLPPHFYTPLNLVNSLDQTSAEYYVLSILGNFIDNMDYSKSTYTLKTKSHPRTIVKKIDRSSFTNKDEYFKVKSDYRKEELILNFEEIVLEHDYDVLWGIPNMLYVNEKVKEAIVSSRINGIIIEPLKDPRYITKSEFENGTA